MSISRTPGTCMSQLAPKPHAITNLNKAGWVHRRFKTEQKGGREESLYNMFNIYPLGWEEKHLHSSWTELTQLPVKLQHQSQIGHRYPVLFSHLKDLYFFFLWGVLLFVFFSLGDDVFYLVPAEGSQRNQFHQLVTNVLKNGAWLHGSNHENPLQTLSLEPP